jgi:hypothetical protein
VQVTPPVKAILVVSLLVIPLLVETSDVVPIGIKAVLVKANDREPTPVKAILVESILVKAGPAGWRCGCGYLLRYLLLTYLLTENRMQKRAGSKAQAVLQSLWGLAFNASCCQY